MKQNSAVARTRHLASGWLKSRKTAADQFDLFESPPKPTRALTATEKLLADKAAYMRSAKWKKLRKAKLAQTRGQCERCGSWTGRKDVHHKIYPKRLGDERLEDLIVVCAHHCHEAEDERRATEAKRRADRALDATIFYNGLENYMTKRYGEDWLESRIVSPDDAEKEFVESLEEKQYSDWIGDGDYSDGTCH